MSERRKWLAVVLAALVVLGAGGAGAWVRLASADAVASKINYQGRLTDPAGNPLTGTYAMNFRVFTLPSGGSFLWESSVMSVPVINGLFNVGLAVNQHDFNGQALWLEIIVNGETLTPRQELVASPYALSLRPGAEITGTPATWDGWTLKSSFGGAYPAAKAIWGAAVSTGTGVRGESPGGYGVYGYSENGYAVYGYDAGTDQARGYGGYFESSTGIGVAGRSSAPSAHPNTFAPGVYGRSQNGVGVYGYSDAAGGIAMAGVMGETVAGTGVIGKSGTGNGVYGFSREDDGVRGYSVNGYGGYFYSENFRGLYASSPSAWYAGYLVNRGGSTGAGLYVDGTLYVSGAKSGFVVDLSVNDGTEPLETGDVVVIAGYGAPVLGEIPLIKVRKASAADSRGVAGVVDQPVAMSEIPAAGEKPVPTPKAPLAALAQGTAVRNGEYLSMVTVGSYKAVKVDATFGAIAPGDLLVSSSNPGYAMRSDDPRPGTVIGKALGSLDAGTGTIPVLVTLQ